MQRGANSSVPVSFVLFFPAGTDDESGRHRVVAQQGRSRSALKLVQCSPGLTAVMEKAAVLLLLFCCLVMSLSGSPLYPSIRFGQRDTSILMTSSLKNPAEQQDEDRISLRDGEELRSERHADAIFTNSYRKVLGQISARKFLQTIMGKRLGDESESYMKRQSDIYEGTFKEDLTSIQSDQRYRGGRGNVMRPRS
ncbi:glucagon family neuropeptides-like [Xiphophorus hellerii]|uniref:glucagon family neuropeptides-like n=1 Tax=Xiphophorus hellerii TaxID=8084 RepID=UPI0013B36C6D|nr:glucagon family neuropeptides-like [Xiphophorus hellerii]XP_032405199.1 glucagon family neuropeptides-like [Xiphophorus hellerii]